MKAHWTTLCQETLMEASLGHVRADQRAVLFGCANSSEVEPFWHSRAADLMAFNQSSTGAVLERHVGLEDRQLALLIGDVRRREPPRQESPFSPKMPAFLFPVLVWDMLAAGPAHSDRRCSEFEVEIAPEQLSFDFYLEESVAQFSKYIRRQRNPLLDRDLMSYCARDARLHELSYNLHDAGITRVGYLVQLSKEEIKRTTGASDAVINRLERRLQTANLGFGMKTIGWVPGTALTR